MNSPAEISLEPGRAAARYRSWCPRSHRCCGQPASTICRAPGCFTRGAPLSVAGARSAGQRSLRRSSRASSVRTCDRVRARPPVRRGLICGSMSLVPDAGPDDASVPTSHRRRGAGDLGNRDPTPAGSPEWPDRPRAEPSQRCSHLPRAFRDCSPFSAGTCVHGTWSSASGRLLAAAAKVLPKRAAPTSMPARLCGSSRRVSPPMRSSGRSGLGPPATRPACHAFKAAPPAQQVRALRRNNRRVWTRGLNAR